MTWTTTGSTVPESVSPYNGSQIIKEKKVERK